MLSQSRVPLAANEIGHRLQAPVADVMIALHALMLGDRVISRVRGAKQRRYYEMAP